MHEQSWPSQLLSASLQIVIGSFNQKVDSAQHREGWSDSVTDVLGVIKGDKSLHHIRERHDSSLSRLLLQLCRSSTLQSSSFILLSTCAPESGEEHQAASAALLLKHTLLLTLMVSGKILNNACNCLQLCNRSVLCCIAVADAATQYALVLGLK